MTHTTSAVSPSAESSERNALRQIAIVTFLNYAARGLVFPFANLYLVSVGFTATDIGVLIAGSALVQLTLTPLLNALADRTGSHRRLYYGLLAGNITATLGLVFPVHKLWLAAMEVGRYSCDSPSAALLSQLTITWLNQHGRAIYGRLRGFGSLGWAVTTLVSGQIFALGGYPLQFIIANLCTLAIFPFARALPTRTSGQRSGASAPRHAGFYLLMASVFLFAVGMSAVSHFGFLYFKRDLGASNQMIGFLASITALAEIPAMILIDPLLRRANIRATLTAGMVGMAGLWLAFTLLTDALPLIPLMLVRGTMYTLQVVSLTLLVARISHPNNAATNQAIAQVTIPGLALLLTGPISGWIFDQAGPRVLFQCVALIAVLSAALLLFARRQLAAEERAHGEGQAVGAEAR